MRSSRTRRLLDAEELVSRQAVVSGFVEATGMTRLLEIAAAPPREIAYHIEFATDASGRPRMTGQVDGTIRLVCQRCLDEFDSCISTRIDAAIVGEEHEEVHERDVVVGTDGKVMLETVIEDELLLALPNAPIHPYGSCDAPPIHDTGEPWPAERSSPFAALAVLREGQGRRRSR